MDDARARMGPHFFDFPEDPEICRVWKEKCGVASHHPVDAAKVCADHFRSIDFDKSKRKLAVDAIPRENLNWMFGASEVKITDLKYNQETRRWGVLDLEEVRREVDKGVLLQQRYADLVEEEMKLTKHQRIYERKIASIYRTSGNIRAAIEKHRGNATANLGELIYKVFSKAQINFLLGKKKVVWSHDDMARAFTLRQAGNKEVYLYLKNTLNMPLPCLSSVQNWAAAVAKKKRPPS